MFLPLLLLLAAGSPPAPAAAKRSVMLTGFDRMRVSGPFEVAVTSGGGAGATIVGDAATFDQVSVRVEGTTLLIGANATTRDGFDGPTTPVKILVSTPGLRGAAVIGGGRVTVDRMRGQRTDASLAGTGVLTIVAVQADQFNATLIGSGTLTAGGQSAQARFTVNGPGTVEAGKLAAKDLVVRSDGAGAGRYRASLQADVIANGSGSVEVEGSPRCRTAGSAAIRCERWRQ